MERVRSTVLALVAVGAIVGVTAAAQLMPGCADTNYFTDSGAKDKLTIVGEGVLKGLKSLRIDPADAVLEIVNDKPATRDYKAWGKFEDGSERDLTSVTELSVDNPWVGVFLGATFTSAAEHGGKAMVTAIGPGATATTGVTVVYKQRFYGTGVTADVEQSFGKAKDNAGLAPTLAYPPDQAMIPPNLLELEFQWRAVSGTNLFELALVNDITDVRVYTKCATAIGTDGCGYTADEATWKGIVKAFKGTDPARVTVRAVDAANMGQVGSSKTRELRIGEEDILGGLFYWNATPGAIIRYDFGKPSQKAKLFFTAADAKPPAIFCVGCHAMSRDGKRMAVGLDMPMPAPLQIVDVPTRAVLSTGAANFMAFSPNGEKILASDGNSTGLYETATLKALKVPLIAKGTMPDWSPDGSLVVYSEPTTSLPFPVGTPGISGGSLKLLRHDATNDTWSGAVTLVPSSGDNNYYPTFSPDNTWIVYNRCTACAPATSSSTGGSGSSYDSKDAALHIIRADGKGQAQDMKLANGGTDMCNSWPKFSPFIQKYRGGKLMWVTFSSRRDYGLRLAGKNQAQIWMAAIDPAKAELTDPSHAAFWLPFQDIKTGNHIAQWTEAVVRKGCVVNEECPGGEFCEDGFCEPNEIE